MLTDPPVDIVEAHELLGLVASAETYVSPGLLNTTSAIAQPPAVPLRRMWHRGRLSPSLFAETPQRSAQWRDELLRTNLPPISHGLISQSQGFEFWQWLATQNGMEEDGIQKRSGLNRETFDHLIQRGIRCDLLFRLPAWSADDSGEVSSYLLYWTDSGILHQLVGLNEPLLLDWSGRQTDREKHDRQPIRDLSWEGFAVSALLRAGGTRTIGRYWRAEDEPKGEIDLILNWGQPLEAWAIEITLGRRKEIRAAFDRGCGETEATRAMVLFPEDSGVLSLKGSQSVSIEVEKLTLNQALAAVMDGP
jgi:hypothetical protein